MIRGTKRPISGQSSQKMDIGLDIHNRFDIEVVDTVSKRVKTRAVAHNVITNNLLSRLDAGQSYFLYIHYGIGNGTPSAQDNSLFTFFASKAVVGDPIVDFNQESRTVSCRRMIQINPEDAIGQLITEVGIGYSAAATSLCTHAMLKDMNGNTISILKTDTDLINIYATVFVHWNFPDNSIEPFFSRTKTLEVLNPNSTNKQRKHDTLSEHFCGIGNYPSSMALVRSDIDPYMPRSQAIQNYATFLPRSFSVAHSAGKLTLTLPRLSVNDANFSSGITRIYVAYDDVPYGNSTAYDAELVIYPPSLGAPATRLTGEAIATADGLTNDYHTKYAYAQNATIYVDGVPATNVTVDLNSPAARYLGSFFKIIPEHTNDYFGTPFVDDAHPTSFEYSYPAIGATNSQLSVETFYNPNWQYGLESFECYNSPSIKDDPIDFTGVLEASDDLINWAPLIAQKDTASEYRRYLIPQELRNKKYWRRRAAGSNKYKLYNLQAYDDGAAYNIHFSSPPPLGSVITADYTTNILSKDENHVFDLTIEISYGQYQE